LEIAFEKRYPVAADVARAWQLLCDVLAVARCMPGAELTAQVDPTHFKGLVKVKVGPVTTQFGGELEVVSLDAATHTVRLRGKGTDKGGSTASLDLTAQLVALTPAESTLIGTAQVILNGKLVQMAGRMITPVSEAILAQFAQNFSNAAAALPLPTPMIEERPVPAATPPPKSANESPAAPTNELNAFAVGWTVLRNWFAALFGRHT
jgi:carbon monoxide dehydrogenase subunit G